MTARGHRGGEPQGRRREVLHRPVNIAAGLAPRRVAHPAVDCDPQGELDVDVRTPTTTSSSTLYDLIHGEISLAWPRWSGPTRLDQLQLLPSTLAVAQLDPASW